MSDIGLDWGPLDTAAIILIFGAPVLSSAPHLAVSPALGRVPQRCCRPGAVGRRICALEGEPIWLTLAEICARRRRSVAAPGLRAYGRFIVRARR